MLDETKTGGEIPAMSYKLIQDTFEKLLEATANLLERDWPAKYHAVDSARVVFFQGLRIAINTFNTIMFIVADDDYHGRRRVCSLALPPLVRTLFEQLISFIFLIQDVPRYIPWMFRTGYNEDRIQLAHVQKYHGSDATWNDYIKHLQEKIAAEEATGYISPHEIKRPDTIGRWPTPGRMHDRLVRDRTADQDTLDYIEYINSWLYRELSGQTHLNISGLTMRGIHFSIDEAKIVFGEEEWEEKRNEKLEEYRQKQVWLAIILMLAIVSEIEGHFHFGRNQKARELWTLLNAHSDIALDFWEHRYKELLPE